MESRIGRLVCAIALMCGCAFGQTITGILQGTVMDPAGASVPNVNVVIKNPTTGEIRKTVSEADGTFIFNAVDPGTYDLTISPTAGFKTYVQNRIALSPNERRDLGKISLTIGSLTEEVSVTATATPLQTSSGENSKLIEAAQLKNITIKGRDLFEILQTVPGVTFGNALLFGNAADATSNASSTFGSLQINGGGTARTNFVVDGVPDVDNGNNSQVDFEPTMDTIAEIRVLTSNYQAEFGHSSGGQISLITKGGSNTFHGSAFYNKRHEMFNSKDYFTNLNGNQKTISRFGVYGFTIGGPVYIPKVWNVAKNKVFFFFSQEYTKTKPASVTNEAMVPTAAQLQGNFYDRCLVNTGINGVPCTPGYTDNNGNDRSSFLVNPAAGKATLTGGNLNTLIGTSVYNPASAAIGQAMLKYLPLPNLCTAAAGIYNGNAISPSNCPAGFSNHAISNPSWNYGFNYIWSANEVHPRRNDTARIDWNVNEQNRVFIRYSQDYDADLTNFGIPVKDTSGNYAPTAANFTKPGHGYALGVTTTLSPTMVNEFTFGKIFNGIGYYEANDNQVQRANMGNPPSFDNFATDPLFNNNGKRWLAGTGPLNYANYVPTISFGDSAGRTETAPSTNPCWNGCPYTNQADSWTFADSLTRVVGKHNLKAGIYVERTFKVQDGSQGNYLGAYTFGNDPLSQNPLDTQDGFANAWLGNYRVYSEGQKNIGDWKFWQTEFYVQDSWRVSRRLTLDLGLRFYGMPPITNVGTGRNASTEFVASAYDQSKAERLYIGECVNPTTNAIISTANGPCPSTGTTKAYDPVTNTFTLGSLAGTFVPNSVANYPAGATPFPGMVIAGTSSALPQSLYTVPFLSPAGRFGFAWDVFGNGQTAVRGGIGQFLNRLSYNQIASPVSFQPTLQSLNLYNGNITNITSGASSLGSISPIGMNADFVGHQQNESTYNGSLQVQQKVGFSTVVEASWVFELRRHVPLNYPLDYFPLYSQFNNGAAWLNPATQYFQNNAMTGYTGGNSGLGLLGSQYIYNSSVCPTCVSGYPNISAQQFEGTSNYEALQVNVRRNMTRRLSYGFAFTWNKSMGPGGALLNNNDPGFSRDPLLSDKFRNWGPSYANTPFYFTINSVYEVPNLGEKLNFKPLGWVTDHWVLSGLYQWRSDQMAPIPTPSFANTSNTCSNSTNCFPQWNWTGGSENFRAVVSGDYHLSSIGGALAINPAASTTGTQQGTPATSSYPLNGSASNQIINTAAFTIPYPCSQVAQADPHYGVGENLSCLGNAGSGQLLNIPGTRVSNLDLTITKNFPLKKEGRSIQFRAEAYNLPNHTQFSAYNITPQYDWRNWLQGRLIQTNANLNRFTQTLNPRQMEMSLRVVF
jgi:Carboxypeptidase regulatory-like domain/TonB-dependent Receptor Plug Domain